MDQYRSPHKGAPIKVNEKKNKGKDIIIILFTFMDSWSVLIDLFQFFVNIILEKKVSYSRQEAILSDLQSSMEYIQSSQRYTLITVL